MNPGIATSLTWSPLFRAIRFRGAAEEMEAEVVYWQERPWGSRISAWASTQSHPVGGRADLEEQVRRYGQRYPDHGQPGDVPVPPDWVGYRVRCDVIEFWAGRRSRLHDRFRCTRVGAGDLDTAQAWTWQRLQP